MGLDDDVVVVGEKYILFSFSKRTTKLCYKQDFYGNILDFHPLGFIEKNF